MPTAEELLAAIDRILDEIAHIDVNGETRDPGTLWSAVRALTDAVEASEHANDLREAGEHAQAVRLTAWQNFIDTKAVGYEEFLKELQQKTDQAIKASAALGFTELEQAAQELRNFISEVPVPAAGLDL